MDILELGAQLFSKSQGGSSGLDLNALQSALGGVIGEGDKLDLAGLVSNMQSGGLGSILESWLGDGSNNPVSPEQIGELLGSDKIASFAASLNIDPDSARAGLSQVLPEIVDKASSGGSLLDVVGGADGLAGMVGKLFK